MSRWHTGYSVVGQKNKGFPHEHNIQVVLTSRRGRGLASISVTGETMLQSSIAIDLFPSDLSGTEVVLSCGILRFLPTLRRFS